jgi:heat shock protein HslJ
VAAESEYGFPFDQILMLDATPLSGSKRVPSLEVQSNGAAAIDLWCASGRGQVHVSGPTITIVPQSMAAPGCPPERLERDAQMLSVLTQVTTWRREGDSVVLIGPQVLRYHSGSN